MRDASPVHDAIPPGPTEPPLGARPSPLQLNYLAANEPDRRRSRALALWTGCLVVGWVPYLCGVVNALVAVHSYSPQVTGSHRGGAALFLGLGVISSGVGLIGFYRARQWSGVVAAVLVVGMQLSVMACLGISR